MMVNQEINTEGRTYDFMVCDTMEAIPVGGVQINGQSTNIDDFVRSMDLDNQWTPYGYSLRFILAYPDSNNMTAFLYNSHE